MNPILYEQTETTFATQGIGVLSDAISCIITEELNNEYVLEMTYPVNGVFYEHLTLRRIIKAKPNQTDDLQPFRIYKITKPMNGIITVYAQHITYDLSGTVVPIFSVTTSQGVIGSITGTALPTIQPFSFTNNVIATKDFRSEKPQSSKAVLAQFIETYGGEFSYNGTNIIINSRRGADNGTVIAYGKNLIDINQEENCSEICTEVYPYYHTDTADVILPEKTISLPGTFSFRRCLPLDLTGSFTEAAPTAAQLRNAANEYISNNNLGVPIVNLTISYVSIEESDEAIPMHMFEGIALGDTVTVWFEKLGINKQSRCIKYVYDAVSEHVNSITVGDKTVTFADTMAKQYSAVQSRKYETELADAVARATQLITNGLGGYVVIHRSNPNLANPDELLILGDSPDISEATKVWRWNKNGLGYSSTGYNGSYTTAITSDGKIVADMITTGILTAIEISNGNGTFHVSPQGVLTATSGQIGGFNIASDSIYNNSVRLHNTSGLQIMNDGTPIGRFGKISNGVVGMMLETGGQTISWNVKRSDGSYDTVLTYDKSSDEINIFKDVYMNNTIYGVSGITARSETAYSSFDFSQVTIETGNPGYININNYRVSFNSYGQLVSDKTLISSYRYTTNEISQVYS